MLDIKSYIGPDHLLRMNTAAILNSRQSKYPVGNDPWVHATVEAVEYVRRHDLVLLTSLGMNTWELPLALASDRRIPALIVIPFAAEDTQKAVDDLVRRFHLDPTLTGFLFMKSTDPPKRKIAWPVRDELIIDNADTVIPVSIRPDGTLAALLECHPQIVRDYTIVYEKTKRHRPRYDNLSLNPAICDSDLLIHFTRSAASPWPDETEYDYYLAIVNSGDEYCRSAGHSLRHIIECGVIFASGRHIRSEYRAVGFTHITADTHMDLFRYRPRLVNPYFEPFGIGITRRVADDFGMRPVIYGSAELYKRLVDADKPYYQNIGADGRRWKGENEWRFIGDFELHRVPDDAMTIVVPFRADAGKFAQFARIEVEYLFEETVL